MSLCPSVCLFVNHMSVREIKEHAKIKSFTVHLLFSLIILVTFHIIFASFYFALFQYFHDIWLKYTPNLEMGVWSGDLSSLLMAIFWSSFYTSNPCSHLHVLLLCSGRVSCSVCDSFMRCKRSHNMKKMFHMTCPQQRLWSAYSLARIFPMSPLPVQMKFLYIGPFYRYNVQRF